MNDKVDHNKLEEETKWMPLFLIGLSCSIALTFTFIIN